MENDQSYIFQKTKKRDMNGGELWYWTTKAWVCRVDKENNEKAQTTNVYYKR